MTRTAVYRHYAADGSLLYVGLSANPTRRLSEHNTRSGRRDEVARIDLEWFDSREDATAAEQQAICNLKPRDNKAAMGRRAFDAANPYLREFLERNSDLADVDVAKLFGLSRSHFTMIRNGRALPSRKRAVHIEQVTGGAIPRNAWDTPDGAPPKSRRAVAA